MGMRLAGIAAVTAALFAGAVANADPMISNGDFQSGDGTGWALTAGSAAVATDVGTAGNFAARITSVGSWSQLLGRGVGSIATPVAGTTYSFEFDAMVADVTKTGFVNVSLFNGGWGGPTVTGAVDVKQSDLSDGLWHHYTVSYTPDNTTALKIDVHGRGNNADIYFDNFVMNVPEPASMGLLGLGALALLRRKN